MSDLFPPNATAQERAISEAIDRTVPVVVREVWNPDTCPSDLLPWLAWAFSVDEWDSGWSDEVKRAAIAASVSIHRKKGTLWAVRTALENIGYPGSRVIEYKTYHDEWEAAGGRMLDGTWITDGSITLSPPAGAIRMLAMRHWAEYAIRLNIADWPWNRAQQRLIKAIAAKYAPVRCHLRGLITAFRSIFSSLITMLAPSQRLIVRLIRCSRFVVHRWKTLDGCWDIGGDYAERTLDGSWGLRGIVWLTGLQPAGDPLCSGFGDLSMCVHTTMPVQAAGGDRVLPVQQLEGSEALDGTWRLGMEPGLSGVWFSAVAAISRDGATYREVI